MNPADLDTTRSPMPTGVFRKAVPDSITLPLEFSSATIAIALDVDDDGLVTAPGLDDVANALARGCTDLVRSYCRLWTRWLARAERAPS